MKYQTRLCRRFQFASLLVAMLLSAATMLAQQTAANPGYRVNNLVSDMGGIGARIDTRVINPWGMFVDNQGGRLFVADNGSGLITIHPLDGTVNRQSIIVPPLAGSTNLARPTGLVQNDLNANFPLSIEISTNRTRNARASLLFVTADGQIGGWNNNLARTNAIIKVDNSGAGALYTAVELATNGAGPELFVANFRARNIEVYDTNFTLIATFSNPAIPEDFAPYGLKVIQRKLWVTYAKVLTTDTTVTDEPGVGNGYIDIFNLDGTLVRNFAANGPLNSPWGLALAPTTFGKFSGTLLVGNNGDGTILGYNIITGEFLGTFAAQDESTLNIPGLRTLTFNREPQNDSFDYQAGRLFFTAGPNGGANGIVGFIRPISPNFQPVR